jgi:hypothetical protein
MQVLNADYYVRRESRHALIVLFAFGSTFIVVASLAQERAREKFVTAPEDAFGVTIGRESLGLYSTGNVRGFSPTAAGNARIDGLYFDQIWTLNPRVRNNSSKEFR